MTTLDFTTDEFWESFWESDLEEQVETYIAVLDAGRIDGESAFEMLETIQGQLPDNAAGHARYKGLVWQLRDNFPDVYKKEALYFHKSLITFAINDANWDEIPDLLDVFRDETDLDMYTMVIGQMLYHGLENILIPVLVDAVPHVLAKSGIFQWAKEEFVNRIGRLMLWEYLDATAIPDPNDSDFLVATKPYVSKWAEGWLERYVPRLSVNNSLEDWSPEDFGPSVDEKQWKTNAHNLLAEFVAEQRRAGIPYGRGDMAWDQIALALVMQAGFDEISEERKRLKIKVLKARSLIPAFATLNKSLASLLPFLGARPFQMAATLELLPAYLRFIKNLGLVSEDEVNREFRKMHKLIDNIDRTLRYYEVDEVCISNVESAWEEKEL